MTRRKCCTVLTIAVVLALILVMLVPTVASAITYTKNVNKTTQAWIPVPGFNFSTLAEAHHDGRLELWKGNWPWQVTNELRFKTWNSWGEFYAAAGQNCSSVTFTDIFQARSLAGVTITSKGGGMAWGDKGVYFEATYYNTNSASRYVDYIEMQGALMQGAIVDTYLHCYWDYLTFDSVVQCHTYW